MIISHRHKFIFIKTRKTAGTSIELMLSRLCGPDDIITPLGMEDKFRPTVETGAPRNFNIPLKFYSKTELLKRVLYRREYKEHHVASDLVNRVDPDVWASYYKFAFDRNPFDKVVSYYYWRSGHQQFRDIRRWIDSGGVDWLNSFDAYSINNRVVVDKVFKYEKLDSSLEELTLRLGLNHRLKMPEYKAKGTQRQKTGYRDLIDHDTRRLLEVMYARELAYLQYSF